MKNIDIIHFTVTQNPPSITSLNPSVPEELAAVVEIMIAKNKEDRVQVSKKLLHSLGLECSSARPNS